MIYVLGDCELDAYCGELRRAGQPIKLERQVFRVLTYLVQHRDRPVPKQELLEQLWPQRFVSDWALARCITLARKAVGDNGRRQQAIKTLYGDGYRYVAAVQEHGQQSTYLAPPGLCSSQGSLAPLERAGVRGFQSAGNDPHPTPGQGEGNLGKLDGPGSGPAYQHAPGLGTGWTPSAAEHKHVTVLCCVVADALRLAERLGPDAMHCLMQELLTLALDEI